MPNFVRPQKPAKALVIATSFSLLVGTGLVFRHQLCQPLQAFCQPATVTSTTELAPHYFTYSEEVLTKLLKQNQKVVLYFWAPWCASCTSLDQDLLEQKAKIPDDVTVLRVEYDHAPELKKEYHVVTQHTFVQLNDKKQAVQTWVGGGIDQLQRF